MKKLFVGVAVGALTAQAAWAACFGGATCVAATQYGVNVQEVAVCSDAACASRFVVGSGARTFDIASATVGSAIGSYAKVDAIPVGVYSHVRVVLSRTMTISGGVNGACAAQNGASLSIPNTNPGGVVDAALAGEGITWNDGAKSQIAMIGPLPSPIIISKAGTRPSVLVKFNTQQGLMCANIGGWTPLPAPPEVTLTIL